MRALAILTAIGLLVALVLAAPAAAETEVAGPLEGGQRAFAYGLSCDAQSLAPAPQPVTIQIQRSDGTLAASLGPVPVAPGATATLTARGFALGFGGSFHCTASAPGALSASLSVLGPTGDPEETAVGRNPYRAPLSPFASQEGDERCRYARRP